MKSTGIVRKVDELGRIVLPIELRRTLDIAEKDSLEIYMDKIGTRSPVQVEWPKKDRQMLIFLASGRKTLRAGSITLV